MNLIQLLNTWDTNLFLFLNGMHSGFFDGFMFAFSDKLTWIPLYVAVLYIVIKHWKRDAIWIIIALVVCIVIADQVSSGIIKGLVQRLRPSHAPDLNGLVHLVNNYSGGRYGFVSSHAANAVGFALLSSLLFKQRFYTIAIFAWALLTAYSRIYLGVHYPLDILGGMIVGSLAACLCYFAIRKFRPSLKPVDDSLIVAVPIIVFGASIVGIVIYSLLI